MGFDLAPIIDAIQPMANAAIPSVVGGLMTALFLRGNTSASEFEKIKAGKFNEALDELLKSGKMSYVELYKCKNFLSIAKIADKMHSDKKTDDNLPDDDKSKDFDIDWFMRFFDAVGNISNEDMQLFWAKVLAREVNNPGRFSLRAMECLRNMNAEEAEMFSKLACIVFETTRINGSLQHILPSLDIDPRDYNKAYTSAGVNIDRMIEIELLHTVVGYLKLPEEVGKEVVLAETSKDIISCKKIKKAAIPIVINARALTGIGEQLLSIIDAEPNATFLHLTVNHWRKNASLEFSVSEKQHIL